MTLRLSCLPLVEVNLLGVVLVLDLWALGRVTYHYHAQRNNVLRQRQKLLHAAHSVLADVHSGPYGSESHRVCCEDYVLGCG